MQKEGKRIAIRWIVLVACCLAFGFFALLFGPTGISPLYSGTQFGHNDIDGNFFLYLGYAYLNGLKPYVDVFDHKGLFIFWIEALGALMGNKGMYLVMSIFMSLNVFCYFLIFKEFGYNDKKASIATLIIGAFLMLFTCMNGHHSGELLNPFFSLCVFLYVRAITRKSDCYFLLGSFVAGLSAGLAFSSRPFEAALPLGVVIFYFVYWLKNKRDLQLLWNALIAIFGFMLPVSACLIEASCRGFLNEMISGFYLQSMVYVVHHASLERVVTRIFTIVITVVPLLVILLRRKKLDGPMNLFLFIVVLVIGIIQIAIARYIDYWNSFIPVVLLAMIYNLMPKNMNKLALNISLGFMSTAVIVIALSISLMSFVPSESIVLFGNECRGSLTCSLTTQRNLDTLIEEKDPNHEKEVYVLDANLGAMTYLGRISSCKYIGFSSWWSEDNPQINEYVMNFLQAEKPYWILGPSSFTEESYFYNYVTNAYKQIGNDFHYTYFELNPSIA